MGIVVTVAAVAAFVWLGREMHNTPPAAPEPYRPLTDTMPDGVRDDVALLWRGLELGGAALLALDRQTTP